MEMHEEYVGNMRVQEELREELCAKVQKFKTQLRKAHKKLRKGSSNVQRRISCDE